MSFTKPNHPREFTSVYGVRQDEPGKVAPAQYSCTYVPMPEGPVIRDVMLKTVDGLFSLSYGARTEALHRLNLADIDGKVLGQVAFGPNNETRTLMPGPDGKLVPAGLSAARDILLLTKNVLSHPAVAHAGEKVEPGMTKAIKAAAHVVSQVTAELGLDSTATTRNEPTGRTALRALTTDYVLTDTQKTGAPTASTEATRAETTHQRPKPPTAGIG